MTDEMIPVPRAELLAWAKAWQHDYDPNDGTDCVTPFDTHLLKSPVEAHCTTCACVPGMTPAVRFDTTPAEKDGAVRDHLIRMGWTPPAEANTQGDGLPRMEQLRRFVEWEREHNPDKTHIAEWALHEIERLDGSPAEPRPTIVLHVDTDGGLNFTSSEDVDVLVIDYGADLDYYEDDEITKVEQAIGPRADAVVYFAAVDTKPAYTKYRVRTYRDTDGRNC